MSKQTERPCQRLARLAKHSPGHLWEILEKDREAREESAARALQVLARPPKSKKAPGAGV